MDIADFDQFPEDAPWLQQPGESNMSYAAFCIFRDMGVRRSLRQTAQKFYELDELPPRTGGKMTSISDWSRTNDWVERAWAYTAHQDRLTRIEQIEAAKQMGRRHASIATIAIAKAAERLNQLDASKLSARDAMVMLDLGVKVERLARGQATDIVDTADDTAERSFKAAVAEDPNLALAAREIAMAMEGVPRRVIAEPEPTLDAPVDTTAPEAE